MAREANALLRVIVALAYSSGRASGFVASHPSLIRQHAHYSWPFAQHPCVQRHRAPVLYDMRPDPPWQRDAITLLAYVGFETLLRSAATGIKAKLGFDLLQLNAAIGGALLVASCWVAAAILTGVVTDRRYDQKRVVATWLLAAPTAAALRLVIFGGFPFVNTQFVATDAAVTLALMLGLRLAEEQDYV